MSAIYHEAIKLLRRRDYTAAQLTRRLTEKFGEAPGEVLAELITKKFLDDRRYAENFTSRRPQKHPDLIRAELANAGVSAEIIEDILATAIRPSLTTVLRAKMADWHLTAPLERRQAARLFRALSRLGYPEDEIREELERLHEEY